VRLVDLITVNTHDVQMSPDKLYSHLYCLRAYSREIGRTLKEMVGTQQSTGATSDQLLAYMLRAFDELVDGHVAM